MSWSMVRNRALVVVLAGGVAGTAVWVGAAQSAVPAAEQALRGSLPREARIVGSRLIDEQRAEVQVEVRGQISTVILRKTPANEWEQDMSATLARGAAEIQALAQQQPLYAQPAATPAVSPGGSLLDTTRANAELIPPANKAEETERALRETQRGRTDPFAALDVVPPPPPPPILPPLPPTVPLPPLPPVSGGGLNIRTVAPPPVPTPTPDPARFARSVQLTGIIEIDGESFALMSSRGNVSAVMQPGQNYESAQVSAVSASRRRVVLREGGKDIVKTIDSSVIRPTPTPSPAP